MIHRFEDTLKVGQRGEERVLSFLRARGYEVEEIGLSDGGWKSAHSAGKYTAPDLLIKSHRNGGEKPLVGKTLEVKCDSRAHETGNAAIEILSNIGSGRLGWGYAADADFLGYLSAGDGLLCIVPTGVIREKVASVWHRCRTAGVPNEAFTALVLLVPMDEMRRVSIWHGVIP